ncbi:hypothetical protein [Flammeovirga kamogawensis]|uniref:Uncharacterized protein n=1 Tax=Flammeovirga kamogawensis TaxID=373891 RepID=A0ABX8GVG3_9BACT|nr:hypothetical protein [Flammeovirga kamogawensis]MBB6461014.1 hypothetical protein [Flammeovirga kamogawensis]QWG07584.1 hypothetical protein KM029_01200 [Flammeovirga kamogawensis]TRX69396.1 hypothetical protein EO216_15140 [Flammeovirga kamogawensis]
MNFYRWGLVVTASIIGLGNIWLLDTDDLSINNNIYEYMGIITMFGVSIMLTSYSFRTKGNKNIL